MGTEKGREFGLNDGCVFVDGALWNLSFGIDSGGCSMSPAWFFCGMSGY